MQKQNDMHIGWEQWSPLADKISDLDNGWQDCPVELQCSRRPYTYLPELSFLLTYAERLGKPILDLACGNGRLSIALAQRGFEVVGLDINEAFLSRAQQEVKKLGEDVKHRIHFIQSDMRKFQLSKQFALIFMMDHTFKYLLRHEDQIACLRCVHQHLKNDGLFVVDYRFLLRMDPPQAPPEETIWEDINGNEYWLWHEYDRIQQIDIMHYRPAGAPKEEERTEAWREYTYQEVALLHHVTGFAEVEVFHDLHRQPPRSSEFNAILVLRKI